MFKTPKKRQISKCGGKKMEIKNESKFKKFFKKFGALSMASVFAVAIAITVAFSVSNVQPVSTTPISFGLPMKNAVVVKDFSEDKLQFNESLKRWEIHLAVDLTSENAGVYSVSDGVVTSVDSNSLDGYVVKVTHENGFVSVYSSLSDKLKVKEGDKVLKGQEIGQASDTASNESKSGGHLHFTLFQNGTEVDPNNYLDLQNK